MANAASTIEIELEIRDAINRLGKLEGELKKSSSAMDRVANSTRKMESAFKSAKNAASALVAAISVQQIAQAADTFTNFANQIRIATNSAAEAAAVQKELYRVSQTTGTAIEDTTKLYARLRVAADQLGSSQAETIRITEIVAKALAAAGTSSSEASGALLQLAQALNSPKVQAEEFNSLIDGMPNLLKEVEKQLGLTAGSLKKFVTDGNLTNQLFKDAILGSADAINKQFSAAQDTIATSFTRLNNSFILLVGNFEKETGFFNTIASLISTLAGNIDELARVLKAAAVGFAVAFAPKVIRAIYDTATAMKVLGAASKTNVIGALAALGFYIADVTGGLDSLIEKLGLTKDQADETSGAIVDLTKGGGGAGASQSKTFESAFFQETIKSLEGYLTDIEKYGPQLTEEINKILFDVNRLLDEDPEFVSQTIFGSDELLPIQQYITELSKIVEIVEAAIKAQRDYNQLKIKDAQITEEGAALEQKILDAKFAINKAQEELNALQKIDIYDGILNSLRRFLGIQQDITDETEKQLSNAEKQAKAREQYVNAVGDTVVTGVFGAGPNASRAAQMGQAYGAAGGGIPGLINAGAAAALSNEKVAAAIEEQFTILFDTLDPLIDVLADLQSAINRLVKALVEGVGNAIERNLDAIGLGPNSYYGGGGFTRDIEALGGGAQGGAYEPSATEAAQIIAIGSLREIIDGQDATLNNLIDAAEASGNLTGVIEAFKNSINNLIPALINPEDFPEEQTFEKIITGLLDNWVGSSKGQTLQEVVEYLQGFIDSTLGEDPRAEAYLAVGTAELIIQELAERIAGSSTSVTGDFQGISDLVIKTAQEQIDSIHFQNLTAQEQIDFRNAETLAVLKQQKVLIELVADEEKRTQLLAQIQAAETKQLELYNLQTSELQKLNEEREREAALMLQQQGQAQAEKLLSDLEKTFDNIIELVQDLRDQAESLVFSQYSTASASDRFTSATTQYQELLAAALDPDATEENVKDFQDFVDTYLKSAQDVFKSSSRYQNIFNSVLADIEEVANFVSIAMPISEIESVKKQLVEVAEEFGLSMEEVVEGLDRLVLALTFRALVVDVPIETVIDEANSDLVVEAVVTAIADPVRSDTEIEAVVKAIMGAGSDTVIDAIVKAVQAPGSDTTIKAVVNAIAASGSDTQIEAVVSAVANQQLSDLQIEAVVTAIMASGSDTVIEAVVSAVEDKILSDTEIEAIVTAVKASGSNTVISAIVSAIAAAGSDTQIKALVTAIAAAGSDTQIEAIVKAIMASGSDTQIEAIVSAVASNTPVISAIVAAVAANTPVVTPNITLNDSNISAAFDSLSQTLENSIGSLIATIQLQSMLATATAEGIYSLSASSFNMGGAQGVISGYSVDLKPRGDFSDYGYAEGVQFTGALSTQDQFSALINSAETENPVIRNNPYYVLFPAAETGNTRKARLFGFTDLTKAEDFYNYYSSRTFSYINDNGTLKYGFRRGGLVDPMDTIPAMLSPGEYILSPETVRRYGVSNLNRLNSGDSAALNATSDPEVKRLLAELIVAVRENDTEVNVYTDMAGQTKAGIEEFRSELRERTRRQGDKFLPARYI